MKWNQQQWMILLLVFACLLFGAAPLAADPITGLTSWFHNSMTRAGSDLVPAFIILGAVMGLMAGWRGVLAGAAIGFVVAIIVGNADAISTWGKSISLS